MKFTWANSNSGPPKTNKICSSPIFLQTAEKTETKRIFPPPLSPTNKCLEIARLFCCASKMYWQTCSLWVTSMPMNSWRLGDNAFGKPCPGKLFLMSGDNILRPSKRYLPCLLLMLPARRFENVHFDTHARKRNQMPNCILSTKN